MLDEHILDLGDICATRGGVVGCHPPEHHYRSPPRSIIHTHVRTITRHGQPLRSDGHRFVTTTTGHDAHRITRAIAPPRGGLVLQGGEDELANTVNSLVDHFNSESVLIEVEMSLTVRAALRHAWAQYLTQSVRFNYRPSAASTQEPAQGAAAWLATYDERSDRAEVSALPQ